MNGSGQPRTCSHTQTITGVFQQEVRYFLLSCISIHKTLESDPKWLEPYGNLTSPCFDMDYKAKYTILTYSTTVTVVSKFSRNADYFRVTSVRTVAFQIIIGNIICTKLVQNGKTSLRVRGIIFI